MVDLLLDPDRRLRGVKLESGEEIASDHVVLALGHSARDTFEMLHERGVAIEAKPFSLGFRIEHPQGLIDKARFGRSIPQLGAADYKLVHHAKNGRSVYSFCMCPGGTVVAAASEPGRVVTNGMSQYSRNERNANAGIVVSITPERGLSRPSFGGYCLATAVGKRGLCGRRRHLSRTRATGGRLYRGHAFHGLGEVIPSYRPGVTPTDLSACLPGLRHRSDPRGPARFRPPDQRFRPSRCGADRGWKPAHRLPSASGAAKISRASTRRACIRRAKARALPAAFCRRRSMASGLAEAVAKSIAKS